MKVKAIYPVMGAYNIPAGEVGELPDNVAKAFIDGGGCEEVTEKAEKKPAKRAAKK